MGQGTEESPSVIVSYPMTLEHVVQNLSLNDSEAFGHDGHVVECSRSMISIVTFFVLLNLNAIYYLLSIPRLSGYIIPLGLLILSWLFDLRGIWFSTQPSRHSIISFLLALTEVHALRVIPI